MLHAVHLTPPLHDAYLPSRLTPSECDAIVELLTRRIRDRVPLAYLTNVAWFAGLPFYVDERVLIPRSPLAELIQQQFAPYLPHAPQTILDVGTGSGCIGIACAKAFPDAQITLCDVDDDALAVAELNVDQFAGDTHIEIVKSDLFAALDGERFDLIVSNPPYVSEDEFEDLPDEYDYEPRVALAAGETGLDVVHRILKDAKHHLTERGYLIVEVGGSQPALEAAYPEVPFHWLDFEHGGDGVFLLSAETVNQWF